MGVLVPLRRVSGDVGDLSDEALLAACGTGDRAALGALFDRFHVVVHRFVSRLPAVDEQGRDDVVQATFLELPRIASHFQGRSSVKTWIVGVAANFARRQQRSEQRRRVNHEHYAETLTATPDRPDAVLDRQHRLERVAAAVAALPHDQQVAFAMCDLEQLSGVEVARAFGIPEGTVWRRLHLARKAIRAALAKEQP